MDADPSPDQAPGHEDRAMAVEGFPLGAQDRSPAFPRACDEALEPRLEARARGEAGVVDASVPMQRRVFHTRAELLPQEEVVDSVDREVGRELRPSEPGLPSREGDRADVGDLLDDVPFQKVEETDEGEVGVPKGEEIQGCQGIPPSGDEAYLIRVESPTRSPQNERPCCLRICSSR